MKVLEPIVDDLRGGENIDLYLTVVAAVCLAALNLLGLVSVSTLSSLTLAILALLASTLLGNRRRIEKIHEGVAAMSGRSQAFVEDWPSDFSSRLSDAHSVWLTGTHHSSTLTAYHELLVNKLQNGGTLKVLLVAPHGAAYKMAAMRFPGRVGADQELARIQSSLSILSELSAIAPGHVEIRVIDFLIDYTVYALDMNLPNAIIFLERSTFKTSGGARKPKFVYHKRDRRWFEHVEAEIKHLWDAASVWSDAEAE